MAQQNDRHLTTERLSALIDQQITAEEQAAYTAHLQTCQRCQQELTALRQTVMLLKALPQPALPRSFALPTNVVVMPERPATVPPRSAAPAQVQPQSQRKRVWIYTVQRSMRAVSTIAAVIGLIFVLSSLSISLPQFGGGATSTTSAPSASNQTNAGTGPNQHFGTASTTTTPRLGPATNPTPRPVNTPVPVSTPVAKSPSGTVQPSPVPGEAQPPLSIVDLGTSMGRQDVGFALLLLGIVGVVVTRRKREKRQSVR